MPELATEFQSLPAEYQDVIRLAQDRNKITIKPLQELAGGWSGAMIYLVSVVGEDAGRLEHLILKLDRKNPSARSDEVRRHDTVLKQSPPDFARTRIAELAFERVDHEGTLAIFYSIAGQSLRSYRPLSSFDRQDQLQTLFRATNTVLLNEWNADRSFEQAAHPQRLLEKWLGFRLQPGGQIEEFFRTHLHIRPDVPGFLVDTVILPNPLAYARDDAYWGNVRPLDTMSGFIHGDLNTNNILAKLSEDGGIEGYYLIDFALFKEGMPLLYDHRYLEVSYLLHSLSQVSFTKGVNLLARLGEADIVEPRDVPLEMAGAAAVLAAARHAFNSWVLEKHPSVQDDLWGQYWLAGAAAGLSYCHKAGQPDDLRLAGLIFSAASLKRFAALFGLPQPPEVVRLYDEAGVGSEPRGQATPRLTPGNRALHNLPAQSTTFIGREQEVGRIRAMLLGDDVRIITLTGPGGTGKTRLSLEIAAGLAGAFTDGLFFVPLADVREPDQLLPRIAQELEVREAGSLPLFENLKNYLRDRSILLILDNFEQLTSGATIVADLLSALPRLKVLVTSRILLNLRGESEIPIQPLPTPDPDNLPSLEQVSLNESVRLFVERAKAAQPAFQLTEENAGAVALLCRRLDGLPLAIELAAARSKLLSPDAILARLADRFKLLTGGARDLPERQRTLRNTLSWSYELLTEAERSLYARLSVFAGGFTLESAEAICSRDEDLDVMEGVTSLVNNSLVRQEESKHGEPRFRMLETIREHAMEILESRGEQPAMRRQHARYFANVILGQSVPGLLGPQSTAWLDRFELEHDNIQACLEWSRTAPEDLELGISLLSILPWFWYRRGFFSEGRTWTERFLALPEAQVPGPVRAMVLKANATLAMWQGDVGVSVSRARESLELWQRLEDERFLPEALMETAVTMINAGQDGEAHALLKEAEALFKEGRLDYRHAITLVHLGNVALGLGDPDEAKGWLDRAHVMFRAIGEPWGLSFVLNNLGEVARVRGEYDKAHKYYVESEALLRQTGDKGDLARLIHSLGYVALHQEDFERAGILFIESLAMFRKLGNKRGIVECLAGLAGLGARQGQPERAATLLGAAETLLSATGAAWWPADRVQLERNRTFMQTALGQQKYESAWESGTGMTLDQAIAYALDGS